MGRHKKEQVTIEKLFEAISAIMNELNAIKVKLESPVISSNVIREGTVLENTATILSNSAPQINSVPVPIDYRLIVDSILNKNFGIEINPASDRPLFEFSIIVPKKYSNAPPAHWTMYGMDKRIKMISYAEGNNGVRDWTERVFKNLNQEIQALVVADRLNYVDNVT